MTTAKGPSQKDMMKERGYIPASEAARRTGISVYRIYEMLDAGRMAGVSVGDGKWARRYVSATSLVDYVGPEAARLLGLV